MQIKDFFFLLRDTITEWGNDKALTFSAALAYFTIFSLAPLLILVIAIAGLALGEEAARGQIFRQLDGLIGAEGAKVIQDLIQNASQPAPGIVATILSLVTLFLGATGLFGALQDALNFVWKAPPRQMNSILLQVRIKLIGFVMVLIVVLLLLASVVLSAVVAGLGDYIERVIPGGAFIAQVLNLAISFGVVMILFAMIFKILPDIRIGWRDVWLGAAVTALLFTIGKFALGLYLGRSGVSSSYGAAGSLIVVILWVFYSAQILFLGAEFTKVYAKRYGSLSKPEEAPVQPAEQLPSHIEKMPV